MRNTLKCFKYSLTDKSLVCGGGFDHNFQNISYFSFDIIFSISQLFSLLDKE